MVTPEQRAGAAKGLAIRLARKQARKAAACSSSETPALAPVPETPAPGPKRLGLADLRQMALARKEKEIDQTTKQEQTVN
jgi:hypothetical protein